MSRRPWVRTLLLIAIFGASFLMRAYHPVSRPDQWYLRGDAFVSAIEEHDWARTYQQYHPGVTTMAIAGYTMSLYGTLQDTPAAALFEWTAPSFATQYGTRMAVGIMGLALVLALVILLITLAFEKLAGTVTGLTAGGLLAFSPFFLTQSRVLHVDALVSALMLLSALLMLLYARGRRWRHLLLSGLVGGLALLTKSPAIFLIPFLGLTLLVYLVQDLAVGWEAHRAKRGRWLLAQIGGQVLLPGLLWMVLAAVPFALWPAMWVAPLETVSKLLLWVETHAEEAHPIARFFAGEILRPNYHPGLGFYPVALALNETFVTISLSLLAVASYLFWQRRAEPRLTSTAFWLLCSYVFFFVLQMSITAKQDERYIIPAHVTINLIAAVGVVTTGDLLVKAAQRTLGQARSAWTTYLAGGAVAFQALLALLFMPDVGGHHNYLFGGNLTAPRLIHVSVQNEGIQAVSAYLDSLPDAESIRVSAYSAQDLIRSLDQYFVGFATRTVDTEGVDYMLFLLQNFQRRVGERFWQSAWDELQARGSNPAVVVSYDGVAHMWLIPIKPTDQPTVVVNRGWPSMIAVAWLWTLALAAGTIWALRQLPRPAEDPDWRLAPAAWRGFAIWVIPGLILIILKFVHVPGFAGWFLSIEQPLSLAVYALATAKIGLAALAAQRGLHTEQTKTRWGWWLLAVSLLIMGIDEFYSFSALAPVPILLLAVVMILGLLATGLALVWNGTPPADRPSPALMVAGIGLMVIVILSASGAYICHVPTLDRPCRDLATIGQSLEWLVLGAWMLVLLTHHPEAVRGPRSLRWAVGLAGLWLAWMLISVGLIPALEARAATPAGLSYQSGDLDLLAYRLDRDVLDPGETATMIVYWRKNVSEMRPYRVSMHWLRLPDLESVAQADPFIEGQVAGSRVALPNWPAGLVTRQRIPVELPNDLPTPHAYQAMLRVWDLGTNEDVPLVQTDLQTLSPGTVILTRRPAVSDEPVPVPAEAVAAYTFPGAFTLIGYQIPEQVAAGGTAEMTFWWRSDSPLEVDLIQMIHFFRDGEFVAAVDGPPLGGEYPTGVWVPGTTVKGVRQVQLPPEVTPGQYQLYTGMYAYPSLERWPVLDPAGQPVPNHAIPLGEMTVSP